MRWHGPRLRAARLTAGAGRQGHGNDRTAAGVVPRPKGRRSRQSAEAAGAPRSPGRAGRGAAHRRGLATAAGHRRASTTTPPAEKGIRSSRQIALCLCGSVHGLSGCGRFELCLPLPVDMAPAAVARRGVSSNEDDHRHDAGRQAVWICPTCGARLVSRNLWHSCGESSLEALFAGSTPDTLELARRYVAMLHSLGDVQVIPQKTRLVGVAKVRFAGLVPRKQGFVASFALHRWLDGPRIVKTVDYGPRWRGHFVRIRSEVDLDDQLREWLQESHDVVGLQTGLHRVRPRDSEHSDLEA